MENFQESSTEMNENIVSRHLEGSEQTTSMKFLSSDKALTLTCYFRFVATTQSNADLPQRGHSRSIQTNDTASLLGYQCHRETMPTKEDWTQLASNQNCLAL